MTIDVQRVYGDHEARRGRRFLVDRIWPRGVRKENLPLDGWLKDVAPSDALRKWFGHDPERWDEFVRRYHRELDEHPDAWKPLLGAAKRGHVILLFGAKDEEHNNAVALRSYLELATRTAPRPPPRTARRALGRALRSAGSPSRRRGDRGEARAARR